MQISWLQALLPPWWYKEKKTWTISQGIQLFGPDDDIINYQHSFMEMFLLVMKFHNSISEPDGYRLLRRWMFILITLFFYGSRSKYTLEARYLLLQYYVVLSPRVAKQMIWNRFSKSRSEMWGIIPLDMALEHMNKILKTGIRNMGWNNTTKNLLIGFAEPWWQIKKLLIILMKCQIWWGVLVPSKKKCS